MFKLVGHESFYINKKTKAKILIEAVSGFSYEYTLEVNGKPLQKFTKDYSKTCRIWCVEAQGREFRICMGMRSDYHNNIISYSDNHFVF